LERHRGGREGKGSQFAAWYYFSVELEALSFFLLLTPATETINQRTILEILFSMGIDNTVSHQSK
jgi:hypothetical protein